MYYSMFDNDAFEMPDSFDEEDIDIFAELGVVGVRPVNKLSVQKRQQEENLAILLADNDADEDQGSELTNSVNHSDETNGKTPVHLSDKTIGELLEVLVKQDLSASEGKQIIDLIPTKARLNLESARVKKTNNEFEISVIIDVDGSGPVRPFAKIKSENNVLKLDDTPTTIPNGWVPLYNILRDILANAMQMLSSTKFTINHNI